ncbi:hemolysin family protein [Halohasta litorea]|uniref:Hemolysin family protein n=1 Tax=Halohasta litorea TaxID=869891 RepID=A0ABD6D6N8_9EURY|nr:hemolysin family protein [Halohasta litorea]
MTTLALSAGRLAAALFLVLLNGFFVAAEFAYVRIRASAVEGLVEEGKPGADLLDEALDNLDDYLAVTQLGITISSLGLGWIGEPAVAALIEPVLESLVGPDLIHLIAFALGFSVITFLHVVFGELAPKTIAIAQAERVSLFVAPPMQFFYYIFRPGIYVFNGTANYFTRLIGIPPASETDETLTEEEILTVLTRSGTKGHIASEEVEMIEQIFDLDDLSVREVMIPRPDVASVSADLPLTELRSTIITEGHTRYPVVEADEPDQIVGFVDVKDVLRAEEFDAERAESITAGEIAREMSIIPETGQLTDLLAQFQREGRQMAAVIDEWGAFEGIVTVEDVIEVVLGDLRDDFDVADDEPSIDQRKDGSYVADGGLTISTINETLGTKFESTDFGTVGGLVLDRLGRAPNATDQVDVGGYRLTVEAVDGTRITTVGIDTLDEPAADESGDSDMTE